MNTVFFVLTVQALMGAFDNLWHHELEARLPQRLSARFELALHAAREAAGVGAPSSARRRSTTSDEPLRRAPAAPASQPAIGSRLRVFMRESV